MPTRSSPLSRGAAPSFIVLAVDDNEQTLDLVAAAFDGRGWSVLRARDGEQALEVVADQSPDLVITDILMPSMDGLEFVRRFRQFAQDTPIVLYTAPYHEVEARDLADTAGASAIVYKDGEIDALIRTVDQLLARGPQPHVLAPQREFDDHHVRLLTDTLLQKARDLEVMRLKRDALIALCHAISAERNPSRLLATAARSARDLVASPYAGAITFKDGDHAVDLVEVAGASREEVLGVLAQPAAAAYARRAFEEGQPVVIKADDVAAHLGLPSGHVPDFLCVPVMTERHRFGILWVASRRAGEPLGHDNESLLASLARQVAVGLDNVRLAAEVEGGNALLRAVVEGTTESIFVKDRAGRYILANGAVASILERPLEDIIGRDDRELLPPEIADALMAADREVMASGEPRVLEELAPSHGVLRTYLSTKTALRDATGETVGLIGFSVDITERKELEARLRQAQKLEAVGRLASGTAHDFNNILTAISGFSELLLGEAGTIDDHRDDLLAIRDAALRGSTMTRQLLTFTRQQVVRPEAVDLNESVRAMGRLLRPLIGEDVAVELRLAKEPIPVWIDPSQLEQVVLNLVINARDAMPDGGRIVIETSEMSGPRGSRQAVLSIADTGVGMDDETMSRMFDPFFSTKLPGQGTGLGLATVQGIVAEAGAEIEASSAVGVGTTFTLTLPLTERPIEQVAVGMPDPAEATAAGQRILVVEDETLVREFVIECLGRDGFDIHAVERVGEAIDALEFGHGFDAVLTDLILPDGHGPTVAETADRLLPGVPILFMSGYAEREVLRHPAVARGTFLAKPFGPRELRTAVAKILRLG